MPDSHRAAALRLAWARQRQAAGHTVWATPAVFTWDAWLARQWRAAMQAGDVPAAQLLTGSQERALWEMVLQELAPAHAEQGTLAVHAAGLIQAAQRATQSLLQLSRSAITDEEQLLLQAITRLRELCAARQLVSLRVALPASLQFLARVPPPLVVGEQRLTALQLALQEACWGGTPLLLAEAAGPAATPQLQRCQNLEQEIAACADWCSRRLQADGAARLLVITACGEPSLRTQAALLWRELAPAQRGDAGLRNRLLGVEGGEPLLHQALIDDALGALGFSAAAVDTARLFALLRSPYFAFGTQAELWDLQGWFEQRGLARWEAPALRAALVAAAVKLPAAAALLAWFDQLRLGVPPDAERRAGEWAQRFHEALETAGFCHGAELDSREQQRLARFGELLDELTALDAVLPAMPAAQALRRLQNLAASSRHEAASGDAAITLTDQLADPVVPYDGIWVMGLAESRWPAPPRPDPYVALAEQRRCQWPQSGVTQRREQALWALARWQQRAGELVLSYPEREGDLHHRPSTLPGVPATAWLPVAPRAAPAGTTGYAAEAEDEQLPPVRQAALERPLSGGVERLRVHQECAFHAQAHWRLAARPPEPLSDGITAALRGRLLHALLQGLWQEIGEQSRLLALEATAEAALIERHWRAALRAHSETAWLPAGVLQREWLRTLRLVGRVLQLERERPPFVVEHCERAIEWQHAGARLRLRIDRIDKGPQDERLLLDYKSGAAGSIKLQDGELEPLQLALYVAALAAQGERVAVAALMSLKPADLRYAGVAYAPGMLPRTQPVEDWDATAAQWQLGLQRLLRDHLAGTAQLATRLAACRYCALPALCRRATPDDVEPPDE